MSQSVSQGGAAAAGGTTSAPPDDTVSLVIGGQTISGWVAESIVRGLERMPSSFDIELTEQYPGQASQVTVTPGSPCQVKVGSDVVITGYVDRYMPSIGPKAHSVRIQGRGKCEDLVDCSAGIDQTFVTTNKTRGMQITTASLLDLSTQLAAPFGITVSSLTGNSIPVAGPTGAAVQFNILLTETPYEIIERVARYASVLAYEGTDGNLILANVGASTMASGFAQGVNIQVAGATFTMDERYSIYVPSLASMNATADLGGNNGIMPFPPQFDQGVPRFRTLIVVSEQTQYGQFLCLQRAIWERNRRWGRSQAIRLTCDSWRDQAGTLWTPNAFAPINAPTLKVVRQSWIIAEVTFRRDLEGGRVADLTLMPKEAFAIEPSALQLYDWQIADALHGGASDPANVNFNPRFGEGPGM